MGRRARRIEERVARPHLTDVIEPEVRVFERVSGLVIDLERVVGVQCVDDQQATGHTRTVYYKRLHSRSAGADRASVADGQSWASGQEEDEGEDAAARSRRTYLSTLPLALSGSESTTSTERGTL